MAFIEILGITQKNRKKLVERKVKKYSRKINNHIKYAAKHGDVRADFYLTYENSQVSYDAVQKLIKVFSEEGYDINIFWRRNCGKREGYYVRVNWAYCKIF